MQNTFVSHSNHLALVLYLNNASSAHNNMGQRIKIFEPHWTKDEDYANFFEKLWLPDPHPLAETIGTNFGSILDHLLE